MQKNEKKKFKFSYRLFNPNFWHALLALKDTTKRFIFLIGGSSSAKTYSIVQAIIFLSMQVREDTLVFRKTGASIEDSIFKDFKTVISDWNLDGMFKIKRNKIICVLSGSEIDFSGLDNPEKIKGISHYKRVITEELSEFEFADYKQLRKRLRGMEGQQIVSLLNTISENHWVKKDVLDTETLVEVDNYLDCIIDDDGNLLGPEYSEVAQKWNNSERTIFNPKTQQYTVIPPNMVVLKSTYQNNFWVVGSPDGEYGFYDVQTIADFDRDRENDWDYYNIYALGNWGSIKTGGEFWKQFNQAKHTGKTTIDSAPIHLSIDNNRLPYIAISVWQIEVKSTDDVVTKHFKQIGEVPAKDPFNTVTAASKLTAKYLKGLGHRDKVYVYGDQTTMAGNTIDDEKRSFFDKYCQVLEDEGFLIERRMPSVNPSVALSGEFVNAIYAGEIPELSIMIDESNTVSISDYTITKEDANGAILKKRIRDKKTGQTYEESGHFSDGKRYFICEAAKAEYTEFSLRRNRSTFKYNEMKFYDSSKVDFKDALTCIRIVPDVNGVFSMIVGKMLGNRIYITDVLFNKEAYESFDKVVSIIESSGCEEAVFESSTIWFDYARDLRSKCEIPIRIKNEINKKDSRIQVMQGFIKANVYFRSDYDAMPEYSAFIENLYDSYKGISIEAANILSGISEYFKKHIE